MAAAFRKSSSFSAPPPQVSLNSAGLRPAVFRCAQLKFLIMHRVFLRTILLFISLMIFYSGKCQSSLDTIVNYVFKSVTELEGNVFIDSTYEKLDTSLLRSRYHGSLEDQIEFINYYGLRLKDWSPKIFDYNTPRLRSIKEFYEERKKSSPIDLGDDSIVFSNFENWHLDFQKNYDRSDFIETSNRIMGLIRQSSWDKRISTKASKATPKFMSVISIYESDRYYLIIYHLVLLQGRPHSYPYSDLILK
jgi:hypothetical protein